MNAQELTAKLKAASTEIKQPVQLLRDVSLLVEGNAKKRAPVRTGTLRRSITSRVEGNAAYVGTAVEYARFVEYGTKYMQAQPYLATGVEDSMARIERMVQDWGNKVLSKV